MTKLFRKYRAMSEEMKAAVWYTFSNVLQKTAPWLVMIILTHSLSTDDYGVYSVFLSWLEIFEIVITLRIYSSGYVAGLVRADNDKQVYSATMQTLSYGLIAFWLLVYLVIKKIVNGFTDMSTQITVLMIVSFAGTVSYGLWTSRKRVDNKYKSMLVATLLYSVIGPVLGAATVFFRLKNPIFWVIAVRVTLQTIVAIPFFLNNFKGTTKYFSKDIAMDAIKYNLPLLPYYLSMVLLNHSDRLMIQMKSGYADAAIYSVAYSAAMMIFVVSGALNLSLQAWLFKALKKHSNEKQTKLVVTGTLIVSGCCLGAIILAPEIILIFGGEKYIAAIWVMPPVIISVLIMFIYQQYVNVLFFYKKTTMILFCSCFAALINIFLNSIFIEKYGYIAAGYTTFVSYLIVLIFYYFMMRNVCKHNKVDCKLFFDTKVQAVILIVTIFVSTGMVMLYDYIILRYTLMAIIVLISLLNKNRIINFVKNRGQNI